MLDSKIDFEKLRIKARMFQEFFQRALEEKDSAERRTDKALYKLGWTYTSNTPGSFWVYQRDFADVDAIRAAQHKVLKLPERSAPIPYGVITVFEQSMAVRLSRELIEYYEYAARNQQELAQFIHAPTAEKSPLLRNAEALPGAGNAPSAQPELGND